MDTKKALLTIIVVLAFALIASSLGQLTGYTVDSPTTITVSPSSISSTEVANREITITVNPGQKIDDKVKIFRGNVRVAEGIDVGCSGVCKKGEMGSVKYWVSRNEVPGRYTVKAYDPNGNVAGTGYFEII